VIGEPALAIHAEIPLSVLVQLVHLFPSATSAQEHLSRAMSADNVGAFVVPLLL
jgi:hypothetical protein